MKAEKTHPILERLAELTRAENRLKSITQIKTDDSFFSSQQKYVNDVRLNNIIEEREAIINNYQLN